MASFFVSRVDTEIDKRLDDDRHRRASLRGKAGGRQRPARLRGVRGVLRRRPLEAARGRRRQPAAPAVGLDRRQEPRLPRHASTSTTWSSPTPSTRCPRRPSTRSPTTARSSATQVTGRYDDAAGDLRPARRRSASTTTTCIEVLEKEGVDKFKTSWNELRRDRREARWSRPAAVTDGAVDATTTEAWRGSAELAAGSSPTCGRGSPTTRAASSADLHAPPTCTSTCPRTCSTTTCWPRCSRWPSRSASTGRRDAMFRGEHINVTEDRAVLHTALRLPGGRVPRGRRPGRRRRRARGARAGLRLRRAGPLGRVDRRHRRADPHGGQHRHRRLRPRAR